MENSECLTKKAFILAIVANIVLDTPIIVTPFIIGRFQISLPNATINVTSPFGLFLIFIAHVIAAIILAAVALYTLRDVEIKNGRQRTFKVVAKVLSIVTFAESGALITILGIVFLITSVLILAL